MATTLTVPNYVPTSFADLFTNYYPYVVNLVKRKGINPQNAEDVAMTILTTFFEKDALSDYDPNHSSSAKFQTFLSGFVLIYLRHYRDRQNIVANREPAIVNMPVGRSAGRSVSEWGELFSTPTEESYDGLFMEDLVETITEHLSAIEESSRSRVQMKEFFDRVLVMANYEGSVNVAALAVEYNVSQNSVRAWLTRLKGEIMTALDAA